ncbi:MAG: hypothetical protein LBF61_08415 [Azoarcus sp.]|jgi:hypothetical protein|nr:hypothetical protein [Azoarcus sp.]
MLGIANDIGNTGRQAWVAILLAALLALTAGHCAAKDEASDNPDIEPGMDMRNEMVAVVIAERGNREGTMKFDLTHLLEKYIKIGDDFESAKEILLKNGFGITDYKGLKEYMRETVFGPKGEKIVRARHNTYRLSGSYQMKYPMKWTKPLHKFRYYDWSIQIFLGRSPESERIDRISAIAKLRAF